MQNVYILIIASALTCVLIRGESTDWSVVVEGDSSARRGRFEFTETAVQGEVYGAPLNGVRTGNQIEFRSGPFLWIGNLSSNEITGRMLSDSATNRWSARRLPKPGIPRLFVHQPDTFTKHFSSTTKPTLDLLSGDTVRTSTLDAAGLDHLGKSRAWGGNPLTGPFLVDGAMPGDVLVVTLKRVRTNRDWAFAGRELVDTVLDSGYLTARSHDRIENTWSIDSARGVTFPRNPTEALKKLELPLKPFLGCLGVAPAEGAVLTSKDSGSFGGNMECRWVCEGAKVYLPVGMPGAFLYLGDGHAGQGDGELAGNALETSMDVEFSVELIPNAGQRTPRIEIEEEIISLGISDSLDVAVRIATSDMARWLERDYRLTSAETAVFLGFQNLFSIPDMVPPGFSVASRIPKAALPVIAR